MNDAVLITAIICASIVAVVAIFCGVGYKLATKNNKKGDDKDVK